MDAGVWLDSRSVRTSGTAMMDARTRSRWTTCAKMTDSYAPGHPILSLKAQFMAAALAAGDGAAISHAAAAGLHGLHTFNATRIDISSPRRIQRTRTLRPHQTRTLRPEDVTAVDGIPTTTVARTLLDLAATAPQRHVERALDQAEILRVFDLAALEELLDRAKGRATKRLTAALARHATAPPSRDRSWRRPSSR